MEWSPVCEKVVAEALRTTLNSKDPERDQIANFWLKQLTATQINIAVLFNKLIEEEQIPEWLTVGVSFLIPKNEKRGRLTHSQNLVIDINREIQELEQGKT